MKLNIITYGCTSNKDNSEIISGLLLKDKHELTNLEKADIIIINSCAVKQKTDNKIQGLIKNILKKYPEKRIIITGCMPNAEYKILRKLAPNASLVNSFHITDIPKSLNERIELLSFRKESKLNLPKLNNSKIYNIQISEGCLSKCNYCSTKLAKPNLYSFPKEEIINEIKKAISLGYQRINLTSTDTSCYGFDINTNLPKLLNGINKIKGNFLIRVGMANPQFIKKYKKELVKEFSSDKIMKFLHLPLQSGSDKVLKEMKRGHSVKDFIDIVSLFRKNIPKISIATDIIVGYPTETEQDFKKTLDVIKQIKPEVLNISKFSSRPNTSASKLKQLDSKIVLKRSQELTKLYKEYRKIFQKIDF